MKVSIVNPPHPSIGSRIPKEQLPPLGLLSIGGPLIDAGHDVELIDGEVGNLPLEVLIDRIVRRGAEVLMIGHSGSTSAHPIAAELTRRVKERMPAVFGFMSCMLTIGMGWLIATHTRRPGGAARASTDHYKKVTLSLMVWLEAILSGVTVVCSLLIAVAIGVGVWYLRPDDSIQGDPSASTAVNGDGTPDAAWKWGMFYVNPVDSAILVRKRFGFGYTMNLANPRAWITFAAIIGVALALSALRKALSGS